MRNINLLPKVSFLTRHHRLLMIIVVGVLAVGAAALAVAAYVLGITADTREQEARQMERQAAFWSERHAQDPTVSRYQAFEAAVERIADGRPLWGARMASVTALLPAGAAVVQIDTDEQMLTEITVLLPGMSEAAAFIASLEEHPEVEAFEVSAVARRDIAVVNLPPSSEPVEEERPDDRLASETYYEDRMRELAEAEDENEALLNELQWLFEREAARATFGLRLPDLPSADPSDDDWDAALGEEDRGLLTDEEYRLARAQWEASLDIRRQLQEADRSNPIIEVPDQPEAEEAVRTFYEVTIELSWAAGSAEGGTAR